MVRRGRAAGHQAALAREAAPRGRARRARRASPGSWWSGSRSARRVRAWRRCSPWSSSSRARRSRRPCWSPRSCPRASSGTSSADLDALCAAGEVVWRGLEPLGPSDGRIALYLPDRLPLLARAVTRRRGRARGEDPPPARRRAAPSSSRICWRSSVDSRAICSTALWDLVWSGEVANDTLTPLRSLLRGSPGSSSRRGRRAAGSGFRSRRLGPPGSEGRWSLATPPGARKPPTETERRTALAKTLLARYGVLTREAAAAEGIAGGFSAVYPVLKAMEEGGQIRRGYFVAGLGATQFALSGADDRLRANRDASEEPQTLILAASDPANPWGAALAWPAGDARPQRAAGAQVILRDGELVGLDRARGVQSLHVPPARGARARRGGGGPGRRARAARRLRSAARRPGAPGRRTRHARVRPGAASRGRRLLRGLARVPQEALAAGQSASHDLRPAPCLRETRSGVRRGRFTARSPVSASWPRARRSRRWTRPRWPGAP